MERCFELALMGLGKTSPNPLVGSVIVDHDSIIGEGYHREYGKSHAEVNAVKNSGVDLFSETAVMYVSLEPCNHYGKTPPCTDLIIKKSIRQVVIAAADTNSHQKGAGAAYLRNSGIKVIEEFMQHEAREVNRRYFTLHEKKRPYIILKWAQTADGIIGKMKEASGRLIISNELSQQLVHRWRSEESAILAGADTLLRDDPWLTVRKWSGSNPTRIVIDRNLTLPKTLRVFDDSSKVIILNDKVQNTKGNYEYIKINTKAVDEILQALYESSVQSLLVEGGTKTLNLFIQSGIWDEARVFVAPFRAGKGVRAPGFDFSGDPMVQLGNNRLFIARNGG